MISPARLLAHSILLRVEQGAWAQDLLLAHTNDLDSRDAGLASEIVYGCLRRQAQLDRIAGQASGRKPAKLDAAVRIALRMGAYQLRHLERVPPHAIVNDSVELVKRARKHSAAGLVNAVLRKIPLGPVEWPDRPTALSQPAWLLDSWDKQFGPGTSDRIAETYLHPAETYVRNPPLDRPGLILEPAGIPGAYKVLSGDTSGLRCQDVGSQSIVPLLQLEKGMTFLDLCSAPGNKTAQAMESGASTVACDLHLHRLENVPARKRVVLDAARPLPFRRLFDRILVDAPCTGTGTLSRNPEIRWRVQPEDVVQLHEKQVSILKNALGSLAPGGLLVYSTCSLETAENEAVVEKIQQALPVRVTCSIRRTPGLDPGDGFFGAVLVSDKALNG